MFDLNLLGSYLVLVVVGICVCVGYVIKTSFSFIDNKYIPCIMALLGFKHMDSWICKSRSYTWWIIFRTCFDWIAPSF